MGDLVTWRKELQDNSYGRRLFKERNTSEFVCNMDRTQRCVMEIIFIESFTIWIWVPQLNDYTIMYPEWIQLYNAP